MDDFEYLSSREESGAKLIKKITGKDVPVTVDPTLTLDKIEWEEYCQYSKIEIPKSPYIFCYLLGDNAEHREIIKSLKQMTGCQIITMPHFKKFVTADVGFADQELFEVSPSDFVKLIANAEYVCTDSFHGTVFSNIYEKKYFVFERYQTNNIKSTNSRIYSLLNLLGTNNRLIKSVQELNEIYMEPIQYIEVKEKLEIIKNGTEEYLKSALSTVEEKESHYV